MHKLITLLFIATVLISGWYYWEYRLVAFPEQNITFTVTRDEASEIAARFAADFDMTFEQSATIFKTNDDAKTYLERTQSVQETGEIGNTLIPLWWFSTRFFTPGEREEFVVDVSPAGEVVGFGHTIPEEQAGARLSAAEAQVIARSYMERTSLFEDWTLIDTTTSEKPARTDHVFTFERFDPLLTDSSMRVAIGVAGDRVYAENRFLKYPDAWGRQYDEERSQNDLAGTVASSVDTLLFTLPILMLCVIYYRRRELTYTLGLVVSGLVGIVSLLAYINTSPEFLFYFDTSKTVLESYLIEYLYFGLALLGGSLFLFLITIASVRIYEEVFPKGVVLPSLLTREGWRTKETARALLVGAGIACIGLAYQIAYYILGDSFGYWAPSNIAYDDLYSSFLPWIFPMFIGLVAALSEELVYRLFGISFITKYLKYPWIGILITSVVWGFLHSGYPQAPWYVRGVELTFFGMLLGYVFLRFGILATIAAHYMFNALMAATAMIGVGSMYAATSSLLVACAPLLVGSALYVYGRFRGFRPVITNDRYVSVPTQIPAEDMTAMQAPNHEESILESKKAVWYLSRRRMIVLSILAVLSLGTSLLGEEMYETKETIFPLSVWEVQERAKQVFEENGFDPATFDRAVSQITEVPDDAEVEYLISHSDLATVDQIVSEYYFSGWVVRFFKEFEPNEYEVALLPDGAVWSVQHDIGEDTPGARLTQDEARERVYRYMEQDRGEDITSLVVKDIQSTQHVDRTDHRIYFNNTSYDIGDAQFITAVSLTGDQISDYVRYIQLPEAWMQEYEAFNWYELVGLVGLLGLSMFVAVTVMREMLHSIRGGKLEKKEALYVGGASFVFSNIMFANTYLGVFDVYSTAIPKMTYLLEQAAFSVIPSTIGYICIYYSIRFMLQLWRDTEGPLVPEAGITKKFLGQSTFVAGAAACISIGSMFLIDMWETYRNYPSFLLFDTGPTLDMNAVLPLVSSLDSLSAVCGYTAVLIYVLLALKRRYGVRGVVGVFCTSGVLALTAESSYTDMLTQVVSLAGIVVSMYALVHFVLQNNIWAYAILLLGGWFMFEILMYSTIGSPYMLWNGVALIVLGVGGGVAGYLKLKKIKSPTEVGD